MAKAKQTAKLIELESQWKRALADYQNLEKRTQQERQQYLRIANASLLAKILPILDDLERASQHLKDQGLALVLKQLEAVLTSEGATEIQALHQEFDPKLMECIDKTPGENNLVSRVDLRGFMMGELVLRPAKVAVGIKN